MLRTSRAGRTTFVRLREHALWGTALHAPSGGHKDGLSLVHDGKAGRMSRTEPRWHSGSDTLAPG
jgi:hypothetical protein